MCSLCNSWHFPLDLQLNSLVSSEGTFAPAAAGDEATDRHNHLFYVATKRQT